YSTSEIISENNYESLREYCKAYVNAIVLEEENGMVSACPKNDKKCKYCDYKLICGHEIGKEDEDELD
ncbi:MAG: hypothetical protein IJZ65_06305, partial [Ruminiclostridium sp.]|nr:hypothetical protein [Ruminiclostridium sp.]